jgi:hypothetical protein
VVSADGAIVNDDVPGPQRYGVPLRGVVRVSSARPLGFCGLYLLHLKAWLLPIAGACFGRLFLLGHYWSVAHLNIRHGGCGMWGLVLAGVELAVVAGKAKGLDGRRRKG